MTNTVETHWLKDYTFVSTTEDKKSIIMDAAISEESGKSATSPMDLILMALTGCAGIDVKLILGKSKQNFSDIKITAQAQRREEDPRIFTDINLHFDVTGRGLDEKHVARAIKLSAEKYCSVSHMLQGVVNITHSHEISETKL